MEFGTWSQWGFIFPMFFLGMKISTQFSLPPPKTNGWIPQIMIWKRWLLLNMVIFSIYVKFPHIKVIKMRFGFVFDRKSSQPFPPFPFGNSGHLVVHVPKPRAATRSATVVVPTQHSPAVHSEKWGKKKLHRFEHDIFYKSFWGCHLLGIPRKIMTKWIKKQYLCNNVYMFLGTGCQELSIIFWEKLRIKKLSVWDS